VEPFSPRLLLISNDRPTALEPVPFQGRVDELTLERWIVDNPGLVGEPLLVLGNQLAEFEEDRDRLDILALDRSGEIVLVELKVSDDFRVTDLQALAYAGAYARRSPKDLASTLRRHMRTSASGPPAPAMGNGTEAEVDAAEASGAEPSIPYEDALAAIASFIEIDDIADWQPSQHVRIKLVAPNFPRRVLQTVKWLGDVYSVRIEAITVRLFETAPKRYSIAFERLLPLPAEEEFDMTIRDRENRQRVENTSRRPAVLPLLVNEGKLEHNQRLWVTKTILLVEDRGKWDPDSIVFQVRVHAPDGAQPKLAWRASESDPEEILPPSTIPSHVYRSVLPGWTKEFTTPVGPAFSIAPGGKTLEEIALQEGLWSDT
jgi:hypothetical protein